MKSNFYLCLLMCFVLSLGTIYAQDSNDEDQVLSANQEKFITLSLTGNNGQQKTMSTISEGVNTVFIRQIGTDNKVLSKISAQSSDIKLIQKGDSNLIDINESSREIEKIITQNGNNNTVIDFSFNPEISTNLELTQDGSDLYFERFGSNELSKNLKFKMSGNARSIIIRSF